MATQTLNPRNRRVFESVFGTADISLPTPQSTPATGFTAPGQSWGGPSPAKIDEKLRAETQQQPPRALFPRVDSHVEDQVKWDRAWHLVTHTLILPQFKSEGLDTEILKPTPDQLNEKFLAALKQVISPETCLPRARQTENVVVWYTAQVRQDFLHQILPILKRLMGKYDQEELLGRSIKVLEMANRQYFHGFWFITQGIDSLAPGESTVVTEKFRRDFNAIVSHSVMEQLGLALTGVLRKQVFKILGLPAAKSRKSSGIQGEGPETESARQDMLGLVEALRSVGLAGERFQVIFAEIMNDVMTEYVQRGCKGVWTPNEPAKNRTTSGGRDSILPRNAHHSSPSQCVTNLCEWIEDRYARLAVQVFSVLKLKGSVTWADKEKYKEMCIGRLAELRINELFDIVVNWPNSSGALDDLRTAITTPQRRLHLTEVFAKTLQEKLLHPGTSTLQILQTYISMIWSFHALDHSKVLLDRVAYPLQLYLCSREDTIRIIITGLLAETNDAQGNPVENGGDKLVELAHLLKDGIPETGANDEELDWHDMEWTPDPVDAGPGYKKSKNADVIGTLIGFLGDQEVFIKEFQNIIGEYLIREHQNTLFKRQELVLDLLKQRFGEPPLQACEVMIKDIYESAKTTNQIRFKLQEKKTQILSPNKRLPNPVEFQKLAMDTKILSRLFWPSINEEQFKVPPSILLRQESYEESFEELTKRRKLTWLPALGQATVTLDFEDRKVVENVHTWQATVIYAFSSEDSDEGPVSKTVDQLEEELEMDTDLLESALNFWVHKLVLHESSPKTYTVLETLAQIQESRQKPQLHQPSRGDAVAADKKLVSAEKDIIYWSFMKGMLTNQRKEMQIPQVLMMLKMFIPGFPLGNDELGEWLGEKVRSGDLECEKGKYRLKR